MNMLFENFQWVEFNQERISQDTESRIPVFEFSSLYPQREHLFYCQLLLRKLMSINRILLLRFLNYHCEKSKDPLKWLISLGSLLEKNLDELIIQGFSMRLNQIFTYIDELSVLHSSSSKRKLPKKNGVSLEIDKIKAHSKKLSSFNEKKTYLLRKKTDYLQQGDSTNSSGPRLDLQIDLELNFLTAELKLQRETNGNDVQNNPILVWNGQVQQLVDLFFQCLHQTNEDGQPFLKVSNEKVIRFILRNFVRTDGSPFSASSLRTMLKPGRRGKGKTNSKEASSEKK